MSTMNITPMAGPFGAPVGGVDLSGPLDDVIAKTIVDALFDHRILLIEHQDLEPAEYVRFGRYWGEPISFFVPEHREYWQQTRAPDPADYVLR
jgi:taurine dioxygenase